MDFNNDDQLILVVKQLREDSRWTDEEISLNYIFGWQNFGKNTPVKLLNILKYLQDDVRVLEFKKQVLIPDKRYSYSEFKVKLNPNFNKYADKLLDNAKHLNYIKDISKDKPPYASMPLFNPDKPSLIIGNLEINLKRGYRPLYISKLCVQAGFDPVGNEEIDEEYLGYTGERSTVDQLRFSVRILNDKYKKMAGTNVDLFICSLDSVRFNPRLFSITN